MPMTKAEMEAHYQRYQSLMSGAREAERVGLFSAAVQNALASWEHIDGMMQYERREGREFGSIPAIDFTLRYAPLLLNGEVLDELERLLKGCKRIEKNTTESMGDKLSAARCRLRDAHRLWDYLEQNPNCRQDELRRVLGGDQNVWRGIAEDWEKMGLVNRLAEGGSYRLALSTRMNAVVPAKCPQCGVVVEAPKAIWLEKTACPECNVNVLFVLVQLHATEWE